MSVIITANCITKFEQGSTAQTSSSEMLTETQIKIKRIDIRHATDFKMYKIYFLENCWQNRHNCDQTVRSHLSGPIRAGTTSAHH